ncbi:MAG: hypothetical protein IJT90_00830 [Bacteroidaceae bacterium]|nr:hypothetical protein [Bacteroidaceae bacterium]
MKTKILTIALLAATLGCYATPIDEAPSIPPTNVLNAIERIENAYGIKEKKSITEKRSGVDNAIESVVIIFPFECPNGLGIMADTKEAFIKDKDLGFQFGVYEPGQGTKFHTYTGDKPSENILTRESLDQGFYYINVKNNDNPTLRDFCGVQWQAFGDKVKGKIFLITSLRPDLVEKNAQKSDPFKMFFGEDGIVSNLPSSLAVDTCLVSDITEKLSQFPNKQIKSITVRKNLNDYFPSNYAGSVNGKVERQLHAYKQLLEMQQDQINTLEQQYKDNHYNPGERRHINKRLRKLHKEAQKTTDKIQNLVRQIH